MAIRFFTACLLVLLESCSFSSSEAGAFDSKLGGEEVFQTRLIDILKKDHPELYDDIAVQGATPDDAIILFLVNKGGTYAFRRGEGQVPKLIHHAKVIAPSSITRITHEDRTFMLWSEDKLQLTLAVSPAADRSSSEVLISKAYDEWVIATNKKDLENWASFLAPGAVFLPPNHPKLDKEEEIREFYSQLFEDDRFHLKCKQELVQVSESEDLAWSTGHCEATFSTESGIGHDRSKWAKVWRRIPTGEWKCVLNSWSSTLAK